MGIAAMIRAIELTCLDTIRHTQQAIQSSMVSLVQAVTVIAPMRRLGVQEVVVELAAKVDLAEMEVQAEREVRAHPDSLAEPVVKVEQEVSEAMAEQVVPVV